MGCEVEALFRLSQFTLSEEFPKLLVVNPVYITFCPWDCRISDWNAALLSMNGVDSLT